MGRWTHRSVVNARTLGVGAVALVALGAVSALSWFDVEPTKAVPEATPSEERAEATGSDLDSRVDRLHREVIALRRQKREPSTPVDPVPEVLEPDAELEELPTATPEQIELELDAHLEAEARDPEWSDETERAVAEVFSGDTFPGMHLVETACASTMCRVVVDAESDAAHDGFQTHMARTPPFDTQGFARLAGEPDAPRVTFYFAREGEDLREAIN